MRFILRVLGSVLVLGLLGMALWVIPTGAAPLAYVTDVRSNTVSVIDTATNTVVATVPVGIFPVHVAITPDGTHAYVTNFSDNTVSVIDTATNTVVATVPVESGPVGVAITPDGAHTYVANSGSNTVSVIDTATNTVVATVPVGGSPRQVHITPDGTHAYVANSSDNTVSVIDTATNTVVATVPVAPGSAPFRIAITPSASCLGTGVHRLRGQVRTAEALPGIPDVTVTLTGPGGCQDTTTTNATGHYVFRTLGSGTYTVTPVKEGCTFTPPSRMVTLAEAALRAHFRGTCIEDEEGERERKEHRD